MRPDNAMDVSATGSQPGLIEAIEARLGPIALVDLTFPRCLLLAQGHFETRVGLMASRPSHELAFLGAMRQRGGQTPIALVEPDSAMMPLDLTDLSAPGRTPVFVVDDAATARALARPDEDFRRAFLFPVKQAEMLSKRSAWPAIADLDVSCLSEDGSRAGYWLATSSPIDAGEGSKPLAFATIAGRADDKQVISARHLLHDGGYAAEGDDSYSWLWTGPSRHFRIVVPRQENESVRRIELSIIRTESAENLSGLVVQINGRPVAHDFDQWSDNSGKVVVDLPSPAPYTILGIVVPKLDVDKNSGRSLGICIDKLILLPE